MWKKSCGAWRIADASACFSADSSVVPMPVTVISLVLASFADSDLLVPPPKSTLLDSWAWHVRQVIKELSAMERRQDKNLGVLFIAIIEINNKNCY
jgi:hypothetical protein